MNQRDLLLSLLPPSRPPEYTPAAFFLHFGADYQRGMAAVQRHLDYFRYTGMDFVKIQYEHSFPYLPHIQRPKDWANMPLYQADFFEPPLQVVEGIVKEIKGSDLPEALVVITLYSPFMCAGHAVGSERMLQHIAEDPLLVRKGMEIITESLMHFVKGCIRLGVDGFYTSTQGGEIHRLNDMALFDQLVRPFDLAVMDEVNAHCPFNILHICDYAGQYDDISRFVDYPGQVVNTPLQVGGQPFSLADAARLFQRPVMGGLDRHGALAHGSPEEIRAAVETVLRTAPDRFILAADCTVPGDTPWDNLRLAIQVAHENRSGEGRR